MPRLSIVIPVVGDPQQLDDTLVSVLENRPANCEILVVHNRPYHDPYNLSDEVRFVEVERGAGVVDCINRGLAASRSPLIHVLTCGVEVYPGWADAALRPFNDPAVAAVTAVVVDRSDCEKIVSAGWGYRIEGMAWRLRPDAVTTAQRDLRGPDTLAAFYRKSAVDVVGGFSRWAGAALAGVDLGLALRRAGFRCVLEPESFARVDAAQCCEPAFRYGRYAERLFWHWASSHGLFTSLLGHVALLAGQSVVSVWRPSLMLQLAGRACGTLESLFATRRRPKPVEAAPVGATSVIASPHFATARRCEEQPPSSRVA